MRHILLWPHGALHRTPTNQTCLFIHLPSFREPEAPLYFSLGLCGCFFRFEVGVYISLLPSISSKSCVLCVSPFSPRDRNCTILPFYRVRCPAWKCGAIRWHAWKCHLAFKKGHIAHVCVFPCVVCGLLIFCDGWVSWCNGTRLQACNVPTVQRHRATSLRSSNVPPKSWYKAQHQFRCLWSLCCCFHHLLCPHGSPRSFTPFWTIRGMLEDVVRKARYVHCKGWF